VVTRALQRNQAPALVGVWSGPEGYFVPARAIICASRLGST
jgi:hypothetical protein